MPITANPKSFSEGAGMQSSGKNSSRPQGQGAPETVRGPMLSMDAPFSNRDYRRHGKGYSRFVTWMKIFLPAVAVLLVVLIMVWPDLQSKDNRFRIGFSSLKLDANGDPSMVNPRYLGSDKSKQTYSITADLARNLLSGDAAIELEMPKADIALADGTWLVLTAESGVYGKTQGKLDLVGSVNLFHDSGYEFRTAKASVDLKKGIAISTMPVEGQGPFGTLKAQGFRLERNNKVIYFTGKSSMTLYPGAGKAEP